jgi:hypothetical protein
MEGSCEYAGEADKGYSPSGFDEGIKTPPHHKKTTIVQNVKQGHRLKTDSVV